MAGVITLSAAALVDERMLNGAAAWALCSRMAAATTEILRLCGGDATAIGNEIRYRGFSCRIIPECTGFDVVGLFVAAVAAFPCDWKSKAVGLCAAVPALLLLNLLRIVVLVLIGARWSHALEYGHLYVAPLIVLTVTLGLWLSWAERAASHASHA
jgi:exosortase/archaeosortase family protein